MTGYREVNVLKLFEKNSVTEFVRMTAARDHIRRFSCQLHHMKQTSSSLFLFAHLSENFRNRCAATSERGLGPCTRTTWMG